MVPAKVGLSVSWAKGPKNTHNRGFQTETLPGARVFGRSLRPVHSVQNDAAEKFAWRPRLGLLSLVERMPNEECRIRRSDMRKGQFVVFALAAYILSGANDADAQRVCSVLYRDAEQLYSDRGDVSIYEAIGILAEERCAKGDRFFVIYDGQLPRMAATYCNFEMEIVISGDGLACIYSGMN